jgi:ribosomal protein S18 acetylase RimI-like enzyme
MPTQEKSSKPTTQASASLHATPAGAPTLEQTVQILDFLEYHRLALEQDEVRHNLMLGLLGRLTHTDHSEVQLWTFGGPGECAMQTTPRNNIILGELNEAQCRALADETLGLDYPGVVGCDPTVRWFVERAVERGVKFAVPIPQQIYALRDRPSYPQVRGIARAVLIADTELFGQWLVAFIKEAVPHDALPTPDGVQKTAAAGNYRFWIVDGEPVSMAGIVRRTRNAAAIAGVYTPSTFRNRGYASAVTAAVVDSVFAEGRTMACLYTDLRNPASNRCYAKIGFKPACRSWHYPRARIE